MKKALLYFSIIITYYSFSQTQIGNTIVGENVNDGFGFSVSLSTDANIIAVGANFNDGNGNSSGHIRILQNNNGVWEQIGNDIDGISNGSQSGNSVSLSADGNVVAFGGPFHSIFDPITIQTSQSHGSVGVYRNVNGTWTQIGDDLIGEDEFQLFGLSLALSSDGTILAIGSPGYLNSKGKISVYRNVNDIWEQIGSDIVGEFDNDRAGIATSISSDGSILAVGIHYSDVNGIRSGQVKVFENINNSWQQIGNSIDGIEAYSNTGISVSLSSNGQELVVGSSYDDVDSSSTLGSVSVYSFTNNTWTQKGNTILGQNNNEYIGNRVSISSDGSVIAISSPTAPWDPSPDVGENGLVRIYKYHSNSWIQVGVDITGNAKSESLGRSISLSSNGDKLAIGSPGGPFYSGANQEGFVQVFDISAILSTNNVVLQEASLYPNPAKDQLTIQLKEGIQFQKARIYNQLGKLISSSKETLVDVSNLSQGMYFVEVITAQGKSTKKLIIK
jgi:hypothetical protein